VIVDRHPQVRILARKGEIALHQRANPVPALHRREPRTKRLAPQSEGAAVDRQDQPVEGAEHVVQGPDRIADPLRHLARREAGEADVRHLPMPLGQDHLR
jgi:hypothetical protein